MMLKLKYPNLKECNFDFALTVIGELGEPLKVTDDLDWCRLHYGKGTQIQRFNLDGRYSYSSSTRFCNLQQAIDVCKEKLGIV